MLPHLTPKKKKSTQMKNFQSPSEFRTRGARGTKDFEKFSIFSVSTSDFFRSYFVATVPAVPRTLFPSSALHPGTEQGKIAHIKQGYTPKSQIGAPEKPRKNWKYIIIFENFWSLGAM